MEPPELKINEIAIATQERVSVMLDARPEIVEEVCMSLANGGSLISAADKLGVPYSRLAVWLNADDDRRKRVALAIEARDEWLVHRITDEIQAIGLVDVREMFEEDGRLKPLSEIPQAITKCISGIDVLETSDRNGTVYQTKRIRMIDKMKALEMLGRNLEKFIERKAIKVDHTYKVQDFDIEERLNMINKRGEVIDAAAVAHEEAHEQEVSVVNRIENTDEGRQPDTGVVDI